MLRGTFSGRFAVPAALAVLLASSRLQGAGGGGGRDGLDIAGQYFRDRNGVWVHTGAFSLSKTLAGALSLRWSQTYDAMSGASRRLGKNRIGVVDSSRLTGREQVEVDGVSGASARETRHASRVSLTRTVKAGSATGQIYYSRERDYASLAPGAAFTWTAGDGNTTLSASGNWYRDRSTPPGAFAHQGGRKDILTVGLTGTRVLTPLSLATLGISGSRSSGNLGHPYTPTVTLQGVLLDENLPARRLGLSLQARFIQGYLLAGRQGALDFAANRYHDDWGLRSTAADLKWTQNLSARSHVRLRMRGYIQGGALFAKEEYRGDERYHTADIRLHSFNSILLGVKFGSRFPESWEDRAYLPDAWNANLERTVRDTRGDDPESLRNRTYQLYGPDDVYSQDVVRLGLEFDL